MPAKDKIILALDVPGEIEALRLVEQVAGLIRFFKVGLELFTRCGPGIVERVRSVSGGESRIFLDLKLHDIPNTVAGAVRAAAALQVDFLTVHLCGGAPMLRAALAAAGSVQLLGVTVLTSSDEDTLRETGVSGGVSEQVVRLGRLGSECGLRGLVASPHEIGILRENFGAGLTIVTPGVRPSWAAGGDDQRRVLTPREAVEAGADHVVIGRPISAQRDPAAAAQRIVDEIALSSTVNAG